MTLIRLSFDAGEADARELARMTGEIIDPVATCCFGEARDYLLSATPDIPRALMALYVAAAREPLCYGPTQAVLREVLVESVQKTVDAEFESLHDAEPASDDRPRLSSDLD